MWRAIRCPRATRRGRTRLSATRSQNRYSPQILILSATYGWTEKLLADRKKATQKKIFDLQAIKERRRVGLAVSQADNRKLRGLDALKNDLRKLNTLRVGFVDVKESVQRRVELCGGGVLFFGGARPTREIPILIGGGGEKKTLRLVAEHADIWHSFSDVPTLERKLGILAEHGRAVGRDTSEIETSVEALGTTFTASVEGDGFGFGFAGFYRFDLFTIPLFLEVGPFFTLGIFELDSGNGDDDSLYITGGAAVQIVYEVGL